MSDGRLGSGLGSGTGSIMMSKCGYVPEEPAVRACSRDGSLSAAVTSVISISRGGGGHVATFAVHVTAYGHQTNE
jgi:hypothetical protein